MKKISQGANKWEGINWWRELSDKSEYSTYINRTTYKNGSVTGKSTKVHLYWAMRNCNGSPEDLRCKIINISKHYQVLYYRKYSWPWSHAFSLLFAQSHDMCCKIWHVYRCDVICGTYHVMKIFRAFSHFSTAQGAKVARTWLCRE